MKIVVFTRAQALCALLLFALAVAGITLCALAAGQVPEPEDAVAVFSAGGLIVEDVEPSATSPTISPESESIFPTVSPSLAEISAETPTDGYSFSTASPEASAEPRDRSLRVEVLTEPAESTPEPLRVLIYHTHTWEAYAQVEDAPYVETEKWRTKDAAANVVVVGEVLGALLTSLGCEVTHDTTAFEPPELSSSYERSRQMLEGRQRRGERYDLYIDLHRDAYVAGSGIAQTVSVADLHLARFMLLVGKGVNYAEKPDLAANTALAQRICDGLDAQVPGLSRGVSTKTGRYNQHVAPCCVLIECGNNRNTLRQVLDALPYLAQAIVTALGQA